MSSHLAVLLSLALAICLSPETLVLGLVIAADKLAPRRAALAYAVGGVAGIASATGVGLLIAHASGAQGHAAEHHGWPGFVARVLIAAALLTIGAFRAVNAMRRAPIADISRPAQRPSRARAALTRLAPALDPAADLPARRRVGRAGLAGFAMCGLHPKVFPIAVAAGHQILQIDDRAARSLGVALFAAIAALPALAPLVVDLVKPGAAVQIKDAYERVMKVHGRWITALLLLGAGAFVLADAWHRMPGR